MPNRKVQDYTTLDNSTQVKIEDIAFGQFSIYIGYVIPWLFEEFYKKNIN